ncbi:MAG: family 16 glycosylhydrolase [Saprospiraceae bacterium]|nr:family 16 glycosylhydrolase [Saprospiraceae bacterium]
MRYHISILLIIFCLPFISTSQNVVDDFEGNGTITTWFGDDCDINKMFANPFKNNLNNSATVLKYMDNGGLYSNLRFDVVNDFNLSSNYIFSIKIYVPSNGVTGSQSNQVSLKLQDGTLGQPWITQSEVIKPIVLNQWQTITFNFKNDAYVNLDGSSVPPTLRKDFNRVLIQVNGENNTDKVLAYIDDFFYDGTIIPEPTYDKLIWSDEFDTDGAIDNSKWFHQTRLPGGGSWYNGEIQHYTNRTTNSFIENGLLKIVAKKEAFFDQGFIKQYTSARLNSKFAFTYGKVEFRAKLPAGVGTWPAVWTLGKNINEDGAYWDNQGFGTKSWPACGEIDIMEHWGNNQNFVQSAIHTPSSFGGTVNLGGRTIPTVSNDFHIYTFVWTPEKLVFSVDNIIHYTYNPAVKDEKTWPFDADQYLLLNIAIQAGIDPNFTKSAMEVDYVRVYQTSTVSTTQLDHKIDKLYYPNPVIDVLNITTEHADNQNIVVKMYSIDGNLITSNKYPLNNNIIYIDNLGSLVDGMYFVSYELNNKIHSLKIIKKIRRESWDIILSNLNQVFIHFLIPGL